MKHLSSIMSALENAFIKISETIRYQNGIELGSSNNAIENASGDMVKKLDLLSHNLMVEAIQQNNYFRGYISEESNDITFIKGNETAPYLISFDPLDGSSNIDANITVGTIFAIYKYNEEGQIIDGNDIVCAGYCLYGSSTQLVLAVDNIVKLYLLDRENDFAFVKFLNVLFSKIYSINECNRYEWNHEKVIELSDAFKTRGYTNRWVGSMVADCHRTLIKGGCFMYPGTHKKKNGKLRLLYEAMPFAFIFKLAGGGSYDGKKSILDKKIDLANVHEYCEVYLGDQQNLDLITSIIG